ncbi:hypothetical protein V2J09_022338 [Rumex salicifolius]
MLRSVSVFSRIPSPAFSRVRLAKMSIEAGPLCPNFMPVEGSSITSSNKPEDLTIIATIGLLPESLRACFFTLKNQNPLRDSSSKLRTKSGKWKARSEAILSLLKSLGTDFLCLQEVDEYDTFYKGKMEIHGYSSIYVKRTGKKRDGCGIFYKRTSAELLLQETIEYNDLINSISGLSDASIDDDNVSPANATETDEKKMTLQEDAQREHGDPNDPCVRLKRDTVGIMGAFRLKGYSDHHVIVANTHLDPKWADVKLAQAKYLLSRLARFKMTIAERFNYKPSLIVTGDFNSTPGDKVYQQMIWGSSTSQAELGDDELLIPLSSLYAQTRGEPPFTNCTPGFTGTLDYIFFTPSDAIKPVSLLEVPGPESPSVAGGLPNLHHPSDHLPIGAEFEVV